MPLQAQQIVAKALAIAKCPGYQIQGGDALNTVLMELAETYNLEPAKKSFVLSLTPGGPAGILGAGSGPYALPTDYLRMWKDDIIYQINGTPYHMVSIDLDDFDNKVQQPGISNYPLQYATDISNDAVTKWGSKVLYVWPPSGFVINANVRYWSLPTDITNPQTSSVIPWFPYTNYLITRVAGEMMKQVDDARADAYLGEGPGGAQGMLDRFLKKQSDNEARGYNVQLDRRRFGPSFQAAKNTKILGW